MRLLLVILLIHGLVPAFSEAAEAVTHYAVTGHLAHSEADEGDLGDQGGEHGCCPTSHRCDCCAPQPVMASPVGQVAPTASTPTRLSLTDAWQVSPRAPDRPFRPPIA